jgi:quercetin dioxygenase-like cupin family protein
LAVGHERELTGIPMNIPGASGATKKVLVGPNEGWDGWVMRLFILRADGATPRHTHPWPHINYIVRGKGLLFLDGEEAAVEPGSYAYIPGGSEHQFRAAGEELTFICIVPEEGDK